MFANLWVRTLVDEHDRILGANDRAEEILGTVLPKYGAAVFPRDRSAAPTFVGLIEPWITTGKAPRPVLYAQTVPDLRRRGQHSTYYARATKSKRILRISASPMLRAIRGCRSVGSFGVLEPVREEGERDRINAILDTVTDRQARDETA